jgi:Sec-independent protein secretion pathway component TatC
MYVILIGALALVIVISAVWTPIFALIIAVPLFLLFLAYVGFSRSSDERVQAEQSGEPKSGEGDSPSGGVWGEERP